MKDKKKLNFMFDFHFDRMVQGSSDRSLDG